jgi:chorismate mutase
MSFLRQVSNDDTPAATTDDLGALRNKLDRIDHALLECLRHRIACCVDIANVKRAHGVPMMQPARIGVVHRRAERFAAANGIDPAFLRRLYELIIAETCRIETAVISGGHR